MQRHRWNTDFEWLDHRGPFGTLNRAVFFSSLTPHLTGPNTTGDVRKTYILQYAPAGAQALRGDPAQGPPSGREPCNHPERQYPVALNGQPVIR